MEHKYENNIICPYCNYEDKDSWEFTEDEGTQNCGSCEKEFNVTREVTVTYSTSRFDCGEGKHTYELDTHFISKRKYEKGGWTNLSESEWKYNRVEMCTICGDKKYIEISKEEYNDR